MNQRTCEYYGEPNCEQPAVAMTTVEGAVTHWAEARCRDHLCSGT